MPALHDLLRRSAVIISATLLFACSGGTNGSSSFEGSVTGLTGTLVLQVNGANTTTLTANGNYTISTALASGTSYSVSVSGQPSGQTCSVSNATGTTGSSAITGVNVVCASNHLAVVASASSLSVFGLDSTRGQLTLLGTTTGFTGITAIGFDPAAPEIFVVDAGANLFSLYAIGAGATLTLSASVAPGAGNLLSAATIDPQGATAYLAYSNTGTGNTYIQAYSLANGGTLNAFGSPQLLPGVTNPRQILVDPNGGTLIVLSAHGVASYALNTGVLTPVNGYALVDGTLMAVNPDGNALYVVDNTGGTATSSQSLISLSIGVGGALAPIGGAISTGPAPTSLTVNQTGSAGVLTDTGGFLDTTIASGTMTTPSVVTTPNGVPVGFAIDSTGTFGYAIFEGNVKLAVYRLTGGAPNPDISNQLAPINLPAGNLPVAIISR